MQAEPSRDGSRAIERVAERLRTQRRELLAEYEQCCAELQSEAVGGSAEEDVAAQSHFSAADILSHLRRDIREIEEALERLKHGSYGLCAECGRPIAANRLKAIPTARRCMDCQQGNERRVG